MNPEEIAGDMRNLDAMLPFQMQTNYIQAPPPAMGPMAAPTMESMAKFLVLLNEKYPLQRTPNFNGNHSIVFDTTGLSVGQPCIVVSVWIFKQLEWRSYPVGLTPDDLRLSPEQLIAEIDRCLQAELAKLIVPTRQMPPKPVAPGKS